MISRQQNGFFADNWISDWLIFPRYTKPFLLAYASPHSILARRDSLITVLFSISGKRCALRSPFEFSFPFPRMMAPAVLFSVGWRHDPSFKSRSLLPIPLFFLMISQRAAPPFPPKIELPIVLFGLLHLPAEIPLFTLRSPHPFFLDRATPIPFKSESRRPIAPACLQMPSPPLAS